MNKKYDNCQIPCNDDNGVKTQKIIKYISMIENV